MSAREVGKEMLGCLPSFAYPSCIDEFICCSKKRSKPCGRSTCSLTRLFIDSTAVLFVQFHTVAIFVQYSHNSPFAILSSSRSSIPLNSRPSSDVVVQIPRALS